MCGGGGGQRGREGGDLVSRQTKMNCVSATSLSFRLIVVCSLLVFVLCSTRPFFQVFSHVRSSHGHLAILVGKRSGSPLHSSPPPDPSSTATVRLGARACRADSVRGGDALRAAPLAQTRRGGPALPLPLTPPPPPAPARAARTSRRRRPSRPARRDGDGDVHAASGRGPGTSANRAAPGSRDAADECPFCGLVRHGLEGMAKRASQQRTRRTARQWDLNPPGSRPSSGWRRQGAVGRANAVRHRGDGGDGGARQAAATVWRGSHRP